MEIVQELISDFPARNPFLEAGNWPKFRPGQFSMFGERGEVREYGAPRFHGDFGLMKLELFQAGMIFPITLKERVVQWSQPRSTSKDGEDDIIESGSAAAVVAVAAIVPQIG